MRLVLRGIYERAQNSNYSQPLSKMSTLSSESLVYSSVSWMKDMSSWSYCSNGGGSTLTLSQLLRLPPRCDGVGLSDLMILGAPRARQREVQADLPVRRSSWISAPNRDAGQSSTSRGAARRGPLLRGSGGAVVRGRRLLNQLVSPVDRDARFWTEEGVARENVHANECKYSLFMSSSSGFIMVYK